MSFFAYTGLVVCHSDFTTDVLEVVRQELAISSPAFCPAQADLNEDRELVLFHVALLPDKDSDFIERLRKRILQVHPKVGGYPEVNISMLTNDPATAERMLRYWQRL